ncbi:MAG: class I SAM-dependent methyltransferase [Anaerolineae bacterium]|nr:class I SAM-dependent methyltransferase [Anaerolineae bacterium]MCI0607767.1 class I SAM-dependent methyltransferase [Anaerolineae bacterium]
MHHHHSHATVKHTHKPPVRRKLINTILMHLHDTELWASHLPRVPKNLSLLALFGFALGAASFSGLVPDSNLLKFSGLGLGILLVLPAILAGLFAVRKWRYASRIRNQIFDSLALRGDEKVLDVGCGSGLLLNGAAMRLTTGKATGIDIWSPHSGGGNLELLWKNARAEGVADKIEFREADARNMPFDDAAFDVVLSSGALHHISHNFDAHERAVREMVRVLKPGGKIAIWDITHMIEATASKMKSLGVECEVKPTTSDLYAVYISSP